MNTTTLSLAPALVDDLTALRSKLAGFTGPWRQRLDRFRDEARRQTRSVKWYAGGGACDRPLHAAFLAMVEEDDEFIAIARADLAWMADRYQDTLAVGNQDYDTWMYAAPMARRALACDWMWPWLDEAERRRYADLFVRDSLRYPYVVLHHRVPAHANNQGMAQALNLVTIGWIFGLRRGSDPCARHLLAVGLEHLHQQIALLPPDAYAGEGSTYECGVSAPLTALAAAVLEAIAGDDRAALPLAPSGNTFLEALALAPKLVPPSGVLPGWDQHGFHLGRPACVAAYLARRSGDPTCFADVAHGNGWDLGGGFAWLHDDHVWTLLWMPDPATCPTPERAHAPWAVEHVGATLVESGNLHAFQHWDVVGHLPIRAHCNPNAVQLEAFGSLLTVDGNPAADYALAEDPRLTLTWWASETPSQISWAGGSIASHSCVQIDDAIDLRGPDAGIAPDPRLVGQGRLVREEREPGWQCIAADAAACYADRFFLERALRSTALVGDAAWAIRDELVDDIPHTWTWRLVLRAGARATPWGFRLVTAEHVVLDGIAVDGRVGTLADVAGFPSLLEKRCHHWIRTRSGESACFETVLVPRLARTLLVDFGSVPGGMQTFSRDIALPEGDGLILELPRTYGLTATLDGVPLDVPALGHYHTAEPVCMPPFVDLPAGPARSARLELTLAPGRIPPVGRIAVHRRVEVPHPVWERDGAQVTVRYGSEAIAIDLWRLAVRGPLPVEHRSAGSDPIAAARALAKRLGVSASGDWTGLGDQDACLAALQDSDWDVRLRAVAWLAHQGDRACIGPLRRCLAGETAAKVADKAYGPRYRIKELCIIGLHRLRDVGSVEALQALLTREEFYGVRRLAAQALADLGSVFSIPHLEAWTNDADLETACAARAAIAAISGRIPRDRHHSIAQS